MRSTAPAHALHALVHTMDCRRASEAGSHIGSEFVVNQRLRLACRHGDLMPVGMIAVHVMSSIVMPRSSRAAEVCHLL